jgi:hypothetical protein
MTYTESETDAKAKAGEVAEQAQKQARHAAGQAREQVRTQIDQRSTQAGEKVNQQGSDLRAVGEQLRQQGKDGPADLADKAAHQVERAGSWLTDSSADEILGDVEQAARKNPWAVVAGGVALGFVAARFLGASSRERYRARAEPSPARYSPNAPAPAAQYDRDPVAPLGEGLVSPETPAPRAAEVPAGGAR